jgi:hypothetical protein
MANRVGRAMAAVGLVSGMAFGLTSAAHADAPPTFTWSGADAAAPTVNPAWSDGANWVGGVAPTAPGPVNLVFPPLSTCSPTPNCQRSTNDLTGLAVGTLSITTATQPLMIGGNPITLAGPATFAGPSPATLGMPITLATTSVTWTLNGADVVVAAPVHGPGIITITLGGASVLQPSTGGDAPFVVAGMAINGADTSAAPAANGTVQWGQGNNAAPWTLSHVALVAQTGGFAGPLSTAADDVTIVPGATGFGGGQVAPSYTLQGNGVLDPATIIRPAVANVAIFHGSQLWVGQLAASNSLNLNSAVLAMSTAASCAATGAVYPIFQGATLTGTLTQSSAGGPTPISNGAIVSASPSHAGGCAPGSTNYFRINYDYAHGTVNATGVPGPAPTATITTQSGLASLGETIQGTAGDAGGPGLQSVILYYHSYSGGPSGAVLATCNGCGPGVTSATWSFTLPLNGDAGIYAFAAQAVDVAGNLGTASNVIYQIVV